MPYYLKWQNKITDNYDENKLIVRSIDPSKVRNMDRHEALSVKKTANTKKIYNRADHWLKFREV